MELVNSLQRLTLSALSANTIGVIVLVLAGLLVLACLVYLRGGCSCH